MARPRTTERNNAVINRNDIGEALAILTGYASDKTPAPQNSPSKPGPTTSPPTPPGPPTTSWPQ